MNRWIGILLKRRRIRMMVQVLVLMRWRRRNLLGKRGVDYIIIVYMYE